MNDKCFELPNHFSRREFMHVGFIGGLGLSLADFLQIKSHGHSRQRISAHVGQSHEQVDGDQKHGRRSERV